MSFIAWGIVGMVVVFSATFIAADSQNNKKVEVKITYIDATNGESFEKTISDKDEASRIYEGLRKANLRYEERITKGKELISSLKGDTGFSGKLAEIIKLIESSKKSIKDNSNTDKTEELITDLEERKEEIKAIQTTVDTFVNEIETNATNLNTAIDLNRGCMATLDEAFGVGPTITVG